MFQLDPILDAPEAPIHDLSTCREFVLTEVINELEHRVGSAMDFHHAHDDGLGARDYQDTVNRLIAVAEAHCELWTRVPR